MRYVNVRTGVEARASWRQIWTDLSLVLPIPQCLVVIIDCCICELTRSWDVQRLGSPSRVGVGC